MGVTPYCLVKKEFVYSKVTQAPLLYSFVTHIPNSTAAHASLFYSFVTHTCTKLYGGTYTVKTDGASTPANHFPALKQSLGCHSFNDDGEVRTVVS